MRGFTLIEVLVALVLVSLVPLGLAGLQLRAQQGELQAYQNAQAMNLVNDMIARIRLNRDARRCYVSETATGQDYTLGTGDDSFPPCTSFGNNETRSLANADMAAWDDLLDGAGESLGGNEVGGITAARGCIDYDPGTEVITVTVAWQGEAATRAPTSGCAQGLYGDERLRRVFSDSLLFADLD